MEMYNVTVNKEELSNIIAGLKSLIVGYTEVLKARGLKDDEITQLIMGSKDTVDIIKLIKRLEVK